MYYFTKDRVLIIILTLIFFIPYSQNYPQNNILIGPNFQKSQNSSKKIIYSIPNGWTRDVDSITKMGVSDILVPEGKSIQNTNMAILVTFQKKNPAIEGLSTLKQFFRVDVENTLARFPDTKFARWQPKSLNPDKINFMSIEIYGENGNEPSPQNLLMIDSGDGYYSISLTTENRYSLQLPIFIDFFNGISLE